MSKSIKLFTTPQCIKCTATKRWLDKRGISYEVIDASADPNLADSIRQLATDQGEPAIMPFVKVHSSIESEPVQWFDFRVDLLAEHCTPNTAP